MKKDLLRSIPRWLPIFMSDAQLTAAEHRAFNRLKKRPGEFSLRSSESWLSIDRLGINQLREWALVAMSNPGNILLLSPSQHPDPVKRAAEDAQQNEFFNRLTRLIYRSYGEAAQHADKIRVGGRRAPTISQEYGVSRTHEWHAQRQEPQPYSRFLPLIAPSSFVIGYPERYPIVIYPLVQLRKEGRERGLGEIFYPEWMKLGLRHFRSWMYTRMPDAILKQAEDEAFSTLIHQSHTLQLQTKEPWQAIERLTVLQIHQWAPIAIINPRNIIRPYPSEDYSARLKRLIHMSYAEAVRYVDQKRVRASQTPAMLPTHRQASHAILRGLEWHAQNQAPQPRPASLISAAPHALVKRPYYQPAYAP
jgi:hypothetical protein